jgi:hypothetical protein
MFHPTIFANTQTLTGGLKFLYTRIFLFACLQTFSRSLMRRRHGAVALDVFFGLFGSMLRYAMHSCSRHN